MDMVTQEAHHRQRMVQYYFKHGGTRASLRFKMSRKTVYKWVKRYDGTLESLKSGSHRPHSHPKQHTEYEQQLIRRFLRRNGRKDLLLTYQRLREKG
ncbi:MAG: integrase, partial [Oscillospiraceae bacterium]|nr:integrase [Oscillospiraceae bacterium]